MVYPVTNTGAQATSSTVEKWILSLGISQSIVHERGTVFIKTDFINWKKMGITLRPRTAHSPRTNGKNEIQKQQIARYWQNFLTDAGNKWSSLAPKFAFAHNTTVTYLHHWKNTLRNYFRYKTSDPYIFETWILPH